MSRFLAAFRAGTAETRCSGPYGADNPGNLENPFAWVGAQSSAAGFRGSRDFRDGGQAEHGISHGALFGGPADPVAARTAFYLAFMEQAAAALAAPDPDLDAEREVMAQHYSAAPAGETMR